MNASQISIIWALVLFAAGILIPIIPAVLIYNRFPNDNIRAQGVIGQLKINATGAFAGYLIVLTIARFMVPQVYTLITDSAADGNSPWIVKSKVIFVKNENGVLVPDSKITSDSVRLLKTNSVPFFTPKDLNQVVFTTLYSRGISSVTFSYPGFTDSTISLTDNTSVKFEDLYHTIDLVEIKLVRVNQEYDSKKFAANNNRPDYIPIDGPPTKN
jgi:hypothetical protein